MAKEWASEMRENLRIDSILAHMVRHHTSTEDEFDDLIAFMRNPFKSEQLNILLKRMGTGLKLQTSYFDVNRERGDTILRAYFLINGDVMWSRGQLLVNPKTIPEIIATALVGQSLRVVVEHPYLPDLPIGNVSRESDGGRWIVRPTSR